MAMVLFKASPLPNPKPEYDREYMLQLIRVIELYFNKLDSNAPLFNQSYRGDFFYGGEFIGDQFTGGAFDGTTFTGDHFVGGDFTGTFIGPGVNLTQPYGSFYDTTNQPISALGIPYPMRINSTSVSSGISVVARTTSFTGTTLTNVLTVTAISAGLIFPGMILTGVVTAGTYVVGQLTGVSGSTGTYQISPNQTHATPSVITGSLPSKITVVNAGIYNLQFSALFTNTAANQHDVDVWFRKNATTPTEGGILDSNSKFTVPTKHGTVDGSLIGALNFVLPLAAGDFVEIMWAANDITVALETLPAVAAVAGVTPAIPRTPGLIVSLTYVSAIP